MAQGMINVMLVQWVSSQLSRTSGPSSLDSSVQHDAVGCFDRARQGDCVGEVLCEDATFAVVLHDSSLSSSVLDLDVARRCDQDHEWSIITCPAIGAVTSRVAPLQACIWTDASPFGFGVSFFVPRVDGVE